MIRAVEDGDVDAYVGLRRAALLESPLAFVASPGDDFASSPDAVRELLRRGPESVILGAFEPSLVGAVGLYRDRSLKAAHKVHLWGMYVAPANRGRGVGARLLQAAVDHAGALPGVAWVHLSVSSAAVQALRLYERAGFQVWGSEPDALRHGDRSLSELHLALKLEPDGRRSTP